MRLGLVGGSFDPVHYGHLLLAEYCREECALDRVWFVPAGIPPHKQHRPLASSDERVMMLQLAIGGHEAFSVSSIELNREGVSYTVDTLEAVRKLEPDAELFLALGADSLVDLPGWRSPQRICELATLMVVRRPGFAEPDFAPLEAVMHAGQSVRSQVVTMPQIDLSSSEIRRRVAADKSIRYQTPRAVEKYIETNGLYRT